LVAAKNPERKTLEYKAKLNINTGDEKAEFLADISSFANASGGDIIFGISDERDADDKATGIPSEVVGLSIGNPDAELGRISQIVESGVQPRFPFQAKVISIPDKGSVMLIRVQKSWDSPHMVTHSNRTRFYSRNGIVGKAQLDVRQIGAAFAEQRFSDGEVGPEHRKARHPLHFPLHD
jgi:predicted HTH transcriptional regulator